MRTKLLPLFFLSILLLLSCQRSEIPFMQAFHLNPDSLMVFCFQENRFIG